jgi:hypothetical protein
MVYGRTKNTGKSHRAGQRKVRDTPQAEWIWSDEPAHPALVLRETWEAAQKVGEKHTAGCGTRRSQPSRRAAGTRCGRGSTAPSAGGG